MVTTRPTTTEWKVINKETGAKMGYRYLGNTGMKISIISYGNMIMSDFTGPKRNEETLKHAVESVKICFDRGINFFDTAEIYDMGGSETQLGVALKALNVPRKDYIVSTKIFCNGYGVNDMFMSRKHIIEGTRASLKRLQLDYVDLIFSHRPDYETPLEEQVRAFSWLIDQGLAFYWGTSEWPASMIEQACQIAEKYHLHAPQFDQNEYNMFTRNRMELEYRTLFEQRKYGTTVWGPVCGGLLTGKFNDGTRPEGTRGKEAENNPWIKASWDRYLAADKIETTTKKLQALAEIAKEHGVSQSALALAWVLAHEDTSTAIVGFTKLSYIDDNLRALSLVEKWTVDLEKRIEAVLQNAPEQATSGRTWAPYPTRRPH